MAPLKTSPQLQAARKHLADRQLIAFLRAAGSGGTHSIRMTLHDLDAGHSLDALMLRMEPRGNKSDRERLTVRLEVKPGSPSTYEITFGHHGPLFGDGGSWFVEFAPDGTVRKLEQRSFWKH